MNFIIILSKVLLYIGIVLIPLIFPYYYMGLIIKTILKVKWKDIRSNIKTIDTASLFILFLNMWCAIRFTTFKYYSYRMNIFNVVFAKELFFIPLSYILLSIVFVYPFLKLKLNNSATTIKYLTAAVLSYVPPWTLLTYMYLYYFYKISSMESMPLK